MLEALSTEEFIAVSQKWQSRIRDNRDFSIRELFDLANDVIRIRASIGLASLIERFPSTVLSHGGTNLRLISGLGPYQPSMNIIITPEDNPQRIEEVYCLEQRPSARALITKATSPDRTIISLRHSASFRSLLGKGNSSIHGELEYENQPLAFVERDSISELARVIWKSSLRHDGASLTENSLPPEPPAVVL